MYDINWIKQTNSNKKKNVPKHFGFGEGILYTVLTQLWYLTFFLKYNLIILNGYHNRK